MNTIEKVHEGMAVVDADGERVGKVGAVSMGDPEAATTAGQAYTETAPLVDELRRALGGSEIPEEQAEQLLRTGFVRVHRMLRKDFLATPEDLDRVDDDTLYLSVSAS